MPKSDERIRTGYLLKIRQQLLDTVYADRITQQERDLIQLANDNQILLRCNSNTFIYNGEWYTGGDSLMYHIVQGKRVFLANKKLHPSIRIKLNDLLSRPDFDWIEENALLSNYFGLLLQETGNVLDLLACLPWQLHNVISRKGPQVLNIAPAMSETEITAFKEKHKDGLHCLHCIYITQLLVGQ